MKAQQAWDTYDTNKNGTLDLREAVALLNSPELSDAAFVLTNVRPPVRSEDDVREAFKRADADKSGELSKGEFMSMWLSLVLNRVKTNPLVVAEALLGVLDHDKNGRIDGGELKILLALIGFPVAVLLPIPKAVGIDYKGVLRMLGSGSGDSK